MRRIPKLAKFKNPFAAKFGEVRILSDIRLYYKFKKVKFYKMTYYINVKPSNLKDFLQIVKSLKNLGVIDSFGSVGDFARDGEPLTTENLVSVLEYARKEAKEGNVLSSREVKKQVGNWTKKQK